MSKKTLSPQPSTEEFQALTELLGLYTDAMNRLSALQASVNGQLNELLGDVKSEYALMQSTATEAERQIKAITLKHPEWFSVRATLKTPFGQVKLTTGTKLVSKDEQMSILLIEREAELKPGEIDASKLIRTEKSLNKEALENYNDAQLARFGITRQTTEDFKVTPATIDLGKAVEQSVEQAKAA